MKARIRGVLAPVVTPFDSHLQPDTDRFVRHCQWLAARQVGLAIFGTNSEAASLGLAERIALFEALIEQGVAPERMMPGTGSCSLADTVALTSLVVSHGCAGVLMLPPFYYKGVSDEGLYRYFSEVVERVGSTDLRIYLYHIPPVTQVPISLSLIERLLRQYPQTIAGVKDSSGDWGNTQAMLKAFQPEGFDVFVGNETLLLDNLRAGGPGCISATANVNPTAIHHLYANWRDPDADQQQCALNTVRAAFQKHPMIPAMKCAVAHWSGIESWAIVRPPLVALDDSASGQLITDLQALGFEMPGLQA